MHPGPRITWAIVPLLLAGQAATGQGPTPQRPPTVVAATVPSYPATALAAKITGTVRLRVETDGRRPTSVVSVDSAAFLLAEAARAEVETWQFVPHKATSFDILFRYSRSDGSLCNPRKNLEVTLKLPMEVSVAAPTAGYCDPATLRIRRPSGGSRIAGVVRCACADRRALANVEVSVQPSDPDSEQSEQRKTTTDGGGAFVVDQLAEGTYSVVLGSVGFLPRLYQVRVTRSDPAQMLQLFVDEDPKWVPEPAVVTHAVVPAYPVEARRIGIEGDVRLRVGGGGSVTMLSGPTTLASAAVANVRSWRWRTDVTEPFDVVFHYRLMPGDCSGDDGSSVQLHFPQQISLTAKRVIPCGPAAGLGLLKPKIR